MSPATPETVDLDEAAARRLLLVRACETTAVSPALWSAEDRAWASRLAAETTPAEAPPAQYLDQRARHACERLLPRDKSLAALLQRRTWRPGWVALALAVGLLAGAVADTLGAGQRIDLLAPPVWAVVLWNLAVYGWIAFSALRPAWPPGGTGLRLLRRLQREAPALPAFGADWAERAAPLTAARGALLLHTAAAGLALGLIAGLYARGLVLDYRAGWQSTFLEADTVRAVLATLLAPAAALTGIGVPDAAALAALRLAPGQAAAAPAAHWIHLYAATLVLAVLLPRGLLALRAAWTAARLSRRFPLALDEPYFQRLLLAWRRTEARVQVLPYGAAPAAQTALGLRAVLAAALGDHVQLTLAAATAHGAEDTPPPAPPGTTLRIVLVDLAATPEAEAHGRFLQSLQQGGVPLLLLADEAAFRRRFASVAGRVAERRAAWQRLADHHGVRLVCADLAQPDTAAAAAAFQTA